MRNKRIEEATNQRDECPSVDPNSEIYGMYQIGVLSTYTMYVLITNNEIKLSIIVPMVAEFNYVITGRGFIQT